MISRRKKITSGTLSTDIIPVIPGDKLPVIPADKLPEIPVEKIPDIPLEKITGTGDIEIGLVNLNDTDIVDATVPSVLLFSGDKWTAGLITDQYISDVSASKITGVLDVDRIPPIPAGSITSGILSPSRLPRIPASLISGVLEANHIGEIPASRVNSGVFALARIPPIPLSKLTQIPGSLRFNLTDAQDVDISTDTGNAILARAGRVWGERDTIGDDFISDVDASKINGILGADHIGAIPASHVNSGVFDLERIPDIPPDKIGGGELPIAVTYPDIIPDSGTRIGTSDKPWREGYIQSVQLVAGTGGTARNGRMWVEDGDIMVQTGGNIVNLSNIGSGGGGGGDNGGDNGGDGSGDSVLLLGTGTTKLIPGPQIRDYMRTGNSLMSEIKDPRSGSELGAFMERTGGTFEAPVGLRGVRKITGMSDDIINVDTTGAYLASETDTSQVRFNVVVTGANGATKKFLEDGTSTTGTAPEYSGIQSPSRISDLFRARAGNYRIVTDNTARRIYITAGGSSSVLMNYPDGMNNPFVMPDPQGSSFDSINFMLVDYTGAWEIRTRGRRHACIIR